MFESLFTSGGLSLDRLRSFLQFAEAGSISKAASGELSRQALISRQIRELEEFFGAQLTHRSGKTLAISPAGERLALLIREQFQDLNDFHLEQQKQLKSFSLGAGASVLDWLVIPAASKIRKALGQSSLRLSSQRSRDLVEHVRDGRLDFAVVREDAIPPNLPRLPLAQMKFHVCVSRKLIGMQPKSKLDDITFLQSLPFAASTSGGQLDQAFRRAMTTDGGPFTPAFECDSLLQVMALVEQGASAGLLPSLGIRRFAELEIVTREFVLMKDYGRALALHWNERQMRRRGVEDSVIQSIAKIMKLAQSSH